MKIIVERKQLKLWVGRLMRAKAHSALPILGFLKLEALEEGRLVISHSNLEVSQRATFPASVSTAGVALVPGALIHSALGLMEGDEVMLGLRGGKVTVECGSVEYELPSLPPEEFPAMSEDIAEANLKVSLSGTHLLWLLGSVDFSICKEETRYALNGLLLERDFSIEEKVVLLRSVCTDGRRLSVAESKEVEEPVAGCKDFSVVIPRQTATLLRQLGQDAGSATVILRATALRIEVLTGGWRLSSALNEVEFPRWRAVVPKLDEKKKKIIKVSSWVESVRSLMAVATDEAQLKISAGRLVLEGGKGRAENCLDFHGVDRSEVSVNPDFLLEALENCPSESADFHPGDGSGPLCFLAAHHGIAWKHVLMPLKTT